MDWKVLAAKLAQMGLPVLGRTIGTLVGGQIPIFGNMIEGAGENIGQAAADMIARSLGVEPTPEAIGRAIETQPTTDVLAKLQSVEAEALAKWPALAEIAKADAADRTAQSTVINETMREEIAAGVSWYHWRHLLGFVPVALGAEVVALLPLVIFKVITANDMVNAMNAVTPFMFVVAGLLGYVAQDTTKLKTAAITGENPPGVLQTITNTVKSAVKKK